MYKTYENVGSARTKLWIPANQIGNIHICLLFWFFYTEHCQLRRELDIYDNYFTLSLLSIRLNNWYGVTTHPVQLLLPIICTDLLCEDRTKEKSYKTKTYHRSNSSNNRRNSFIHMMSHLKEKALKANSSLSACFTSHMCVRVFYKQWVRWWSLAKYQNLPPNVK